MNKVSRLGSALARLAALMCACVIAACGDVGAGSPPGASDSPPASNCVADCGTVYLAITDADGDFLSYTVDVVSIRLKRANGTLVETLPATTRIDFAQYVDLTEFLTAATVPNGSYVAGSLRLDYSNAAITVERDGVPVAAQAVDASGNPLGQVDVNVTLDNRHHLVVSPGRPSLFSLDFNLAATNSVDLGATPAIVTVTPALVASLDFVDQKDLRLRGPLVSVDAGAGTYVVDVRPFNVREKKHFGQVTVHTDSNTEFEVNGTNYTGSAGLAALDAAGAGTLTAAFGTLTPANREFDATVVHAGTSLPAAGVDSVFGEVIARSGDVLTVRGATVTREDDGAHFVRGNVRVTLGPDTKVVKGGTMPVQGVTTDAISVGQSIEAFGTANPAPSTLMSDDWMLNATRGRVRMNPTPIYGFVKQSSTGALTLQLASIAGRRISSFDFTGTGATPAEDADPMNYEVATGEMDAASLDIGEPAKLIGFPTPFGAAPPDFSARTLIDVHKLGASLMMSWGPGGTQAPFSSQEPTALVLNIQNPDIGRLHALSIGPQVLDILKLSASPSIVPPADGPTAYLIVMRDDSRAFQDFSDFVTALGTALNGDTAMVGLTASGTYEATANVLTARSVIVVLK